MSLTPEEEILLDLLMKKRGKMGRYPSSPQIQTPQDDYPCLHKSCSSCGGSGITPGGNLCFHMISCPRPKCSPRCTTMPTWETYGVGDPRFPPGATQFANLPSML